MTAREPHTGTHDERRSALATTPLERRRADRALRRILRTQSLHPGQLAVLQRGGGDGSSALRLALTVARDAHAPPRALERAPEPARPADPAPARARTPASTESRPRPWAGDAVAQAQTLRDAAREGVPFCAVCEAARQRRERAAAQA